MRSVRRIGFCLTVFGLAFAAPLGRTSATAAEGPAGKKLVFLAGKKSHGPGLHEYEKGLKLLARCLDSSPNVKGIKIEVHTDDWPANPATLDDADTIVLFSDGSDRNEQAHPLLQGDHLAVIGRQMKRGCGLVVIHYSTFVPCKPAGDDMLKWVGGYFDYQSGPGKRGWYSKIRTATTTCTPVTPEHPICRGLKPFELREEYYYNIRFCPNDKRLVPILTTPIPGEPDVQVVGWAVERADGGRGFGFTGGHFHHQWKLENLRRLMLNAILWTAKAEVPQGGVRSTVGSGQWAVGSGQWAVSSGSAPVEG